MLPKAKHPLLEWWILFQTFSFLEKFWQEVMIFLYIEKISDVFRSVRFSEQL